MPVVHGGDVFDKWDVPVEFVNLIIEHMPDDVWGIPGQHDLPNHRTEDIRRSAYWNLCHSGRFHNLTASTVIGRGGPFVEVFPFPWGFPPEPPPQGTLPGRIRLAVAHRYYWFDKDKNPGRGGPQENLCMGGVRGKFDGYHAVLIGDCHTPWIYKNDGRAFFNHGTSLRRHSDERDLTVGPGVLYSDGSVERVELILPAEQWADSFDAAKSVEPAGIDARELLALLRRGGDAVVSFRGAVRAILDADKDIPPGVRNVIRGWVG